MATSQRIRMRDMRAVFDLLGEVRELGHDPAAWRSHLLQSGSRLIGADVAMTMDMRNAALHAPAELIEPCTCGWSSPAEEARYYRYFADYEMIDDPGACAVFAAHQGNRRLAAARRCERIDDRIWYFSPQVSGARRESGVDDFVFASAMLAPAVMQGLIFYRGWGERPFAIHERRLLRLLHVSLLRIIFRARRQQKALMKEWRLSPRLQATFELLMGSGSAKEIATTLHVTPQTLNGYIKLVYDRMRVSNRLELVDQFKRRWTNQIMLPQQLLALMIDG